MSVAVTGIGVVAPPASAGSERLCEIPLDAIPADKRSRIGRLDRLCRLYLAASYLAVGDAGLPLDLDAGERVGLSFGTALGCLLTNAEYWDKIVEQGVAAASPRLFAYTVSSAAAGEVSIALGIRGPNVTQHVGFAAGLGAVGYGFDLIEMGRADMILAGGADANGPVIAEALRDMGLLKTAATSRPFADAIPGVAPSEGAVVLLLENAEHAAARGARIYGQIDGYAAGFEPSLASASPEPRGVIETMQRALRQSGIDADDVDLAVTSAQGTPADAAENAALERVLGAETGRLSPKETFGETFAASPLLGLAQVLGRAPTPSPLAPARVVMLQGLCYSGPVLSLVFTRRE